MNQLLFRLSLIAVALLSSSQFIHAQIPGGGANPFNPAMLKMFGSQTNFTATAEMKVSDDSDTLVATSKMAVLNGKMRVEMDLTKIKSKALDPAVLAQMKKMGADVTIIIIRPDKGVSYMVYPGLNAYVETPISEADKLAFAKKPKITTTALGKETIDGHPCVKNKVVVTDDKGKAQDMIVWNASDLKNFPVQMEMKEKDAAIVTKFTNLQFVKPDAKQFEPPATYKKYTGMAQIQQVMMQKMMGNAPQK